MNKTLYHVSSVAGITELVPRKGTHDKAYVYATENKALSLLFGSYKSMGDFDGMYGVRNGVPYFFEAYPGAFKRCYEGCECYIYEVDSKGFKEGMTSFSAEVVNENPVKVKNCTKVDDLYGKLMEMAKSGELQLVEYTFDEKYSKMMEQHVEDRIIRFNILDKPESNTYKFCMDCYPHIMRRLIEEKGIKQ